MKNINQYKAGSQKGASIALVILAILGLVFLAQFLGYDIRSYWPILLVIFIVILIMGTGR